MIQAHILVIDDNPAVLQSLRLVLKSAFSTVGAVSDPALIPAIIREGNVDVVVLDMNFGKGKMDGADGMFWLDRIKHHSQLGNPPSVVLITAFGDVSLAVESMKHGADDFIQKPWDNALLVRKITEAVQKRAEDVLRRKPTEAEEKQNLGPETNQSLEEPCRRSMESMSALADIERAHIKEIIAGHNGNIKAAAKALGISRSTLYNKMKRYGLI